MRKKVYIYDRDDGGYIRYSATYKEQSDDFIQGMKEACNNISDNLSVIAPWSSTSLDQINAINEYDSRMLRAELKVKIEEIKALDDKIKTLKDALEKVSSS